MSIGATSNSVHQSPIRGNEKPSGQSFNAHIAFGEEDIKKKNIHGTEGVQLTPMQQNVSVFC